MQTLGNFYQFLYILQDIIIQFDCRIWGDQGQAALENASVCLLNCGPTGSETLKNLVLGGIGSITVVDGSRIEIGDLGNNFMGMVLLSLVYIMLYVSNHCIISAQAPSFFVLAAKMENAVAKMFHLIDAAVSISPVEESSLGESKAKCVCTLLQELNDAVKAKFIEEYPEKLIETNPSFFSQFTLVIATQVLESHFLCYSSGKTILKF